MRVKLGLLLALLFFAIGPFQQKITPESSGPPSAEWLTEWEDGLLCQPPSPEAKQADRDREGRWKREAPRRNF